MGLDAVRHAPKGSRVIEAADQWNWCRDSSTGTSTLPDGGARRASHFMPDPAGVPTPDRRRRSETTAALLAGVSLPCHVGGRTVAAHVGGSTLARESPSRIRCRRSHRVQRPLVRHPTIRSPSSSRTDDPILAHEGRRQRRGKGFRRSGVEARFHRSGSCTAKGRSRGAGPRPAAIDAIMRAGSGRPVHATKAQHRASQCERGATIPRDSVDDELDDAFVEAVVRKRCSMFPTRSWARDTATSDCAGSGSTRVGRAVRAT